MFSENIGKSMIRFIIIAILLSFAIANSYQQNEVMVEMSDGIKLSTIIYTPDDMSKAPYPVILARTPYNAEENAQQLSGFLRIVTDTEKYIVVVQNVRGKNGSEGKNMSFLEDGWGEKKDGLETINWIANQVWCNGDIGMFGPSALAISQYLAAGAVPENLRCGFPLVGAWSLYHNMAYQGGQFRQLDAGLWVPLFSSPDMLDTIHAHYNYDEMWDLVNCHNRVHLMKTPMFHVGGWYDLFAPGQIQAFYDMQYNGGEGARNNQKLMIGPWTHGTLGSKKSGDITFPETAVVKLEELAISWFNFALKGQEGGWAAAMAPINLYLMGPDDQQGYWNDWLHFYDWPFTDTDTLRLYPNKNGNLIKQLLEEDQKHILTTQCCLFQLRVEI
jgi:predicted acyl esterase